MVLLLVGLIHTHLLLISMIKERSANGNIFFKFYHVYKEEPYKAYVRVIKLSFAKSSARDYNTIRARLKCDLGFKLNPTKLLVFKDGKYEYLSKEGL